MDKNIHSCKDNCNKDLTSENIDSELSPIKKNILIIISACLFSVLIWGTVTATDFIIDFILKLF